MQDFPEEPSEVASGPVLSRAELLLERMSTREKVYQLFMVFPSAVTEMLTTVQTYSKIPLILTCDEEGGRVNRLMSTVGTTYIDSMMSYRDQGPEKAAENAEIIAGDLVSCGFNTDLAPVADVWSNPRNTVIGDRAYSDDFAQAAALIAAAVETGVISEERLNESVLRILSLKENMGILQEENQ